MEFSFYVGGPKNKKYYINLHVYIFRMYSSTDNTTTSTKTTPRRLLDYILPSQHRRLLNIVGYSTSLATEHRRLLNIINLVYNRNKETNQENPGLLDLTDYSTIVPPSSICFSNRRPPCICLH
jgi:hypothetical protein